MKKLLIVFMLAMVFLCGLALAAEEPTGFKDAKWGMTIDQAHDLEILVEKTGFLGDTVVMFRGRGETIGNIGVTTSYFFYSSTCKKDGGYKDCLDAQPKLGGVLIKVILPHEAQTILSALIEKYGEPITKQLKNVYGNTIGSSYKWMVGKVMISFSLNQAKRDYILQYNYGPICGVAIEKDKEDKDKSKKDL